MSVREANLDDVAAMVDLAEQKRQQYRAYAPTFYRPAPNARDMHRAWIAKLVADEDVATFVHDNHEGGIDAFIIANLVPAPPVYDPGGLTCSVDDFTVADPSKWGSVGLDLLEAAQEWSRPRGAVQTVVVCGPHDQPKRQMLLEAGLDVASEWFTGPLDAGGTASAG